MQNENILNYEVIKNLCNQIAAIQKDHNQVIIVSSAGVLIRTSVSEIAEQRRDATGVRIMNVGEDETVAALSPVTPDFDEIAEVSSSN